MSNSQICLISKQRPSSISWVNIAPAICKIYTKRRLTQWMVDNNKLSDSQNGFRRSRSTIDLPPKLLYVECRKSQRKSTYAAFIDLRKKYNKVDRQKLLYKLRAAGVKGKFYNSIISLYNNTMSFVKIGEHLTDWFKVDRRL